MKKTISCLIALFIFICMSSFQVSATSIDNSENNDLSEKATQVSEVMNFEEMADCIAQDTGMTKDEAISILLQNPVYSVNSLSIATPMDATYRTLYDTLDVTTTYRPKVKFYCRTTESSTMGGIVSIEYAYLDRSYNGISKQFGGSLWYKFMDMNNIYYVIEGDWYNNGSTTYTGSGSISVGGIGTVTFSVSITTNHYKYTCIEDTLRWGH